MTFGIGKRTVQERIRRFTGLIVPLCLLVFASAATVQAQPRTILLEATDLNGDPVADVTVSISTITTGFVAVPGSVQAEQGTYDWEVELGGVAVNPSTLSLAIGNSRTITYNPVTGAEISNQFTAGVQKIIFRFDIRSVSLNAIDVKDLDVANVSVEFVSPANLGTVSLPTTVKMPTAGATVNVIRSGAQVNGTAFSIVPKTSFTKRYQAETGVFNNESFTSGTTAIVFRMAIQNVEFAAVGAQGGALSGVSVDFVTPSLGLIALPATVSVPTAGFTANVQFNGTQVNGSPLSMVHKSGFTKKYQAETGAFNGETFSGAVTKIVLDNNVLNVAYTGVDLNDVALSGTSFEFGPGGGTDIPLPAGQVTRLISQQVTAKKDGSAINTFSIFPEKTRRKIYDVVLGTEISNTFISVGAEVVFKYGVTTVDFTAEDATGAAVADASFEFGTGGGTDLPLPHTAPVVTESQTVTVKRNGTVLNTFAIVPVKTREKIYSVATGLEIGDTFAGTETRVIFKYDVSSVTFDAVSSLGGPVNGASFEFGAGGGTDVTFPHTAAIALGPTQISSKRDGVILNTFSVSPATSREKTYDAITGQEIGDVFASGQTRIILKYDVATVDFTGVDLDGDATPDVSFEFGPGGGTDNALPHSEQIILGPRQITAKRKGAALNTFSISPEKTRRKVYNVLTGLETANTFAGTSVTEVVFEYDYLDVQLKSIDLMDNDITGTQIDIPGVTNGPLDIDGASVILPVTGVTADLITGGVTVNASPITLVPRQAFSKTILAATGVVTKEIFTDPAAGYPVTVNEFIFKFPVATVDFLAVDIQGEAMPDVSFEFGTGGGTDHPLPFTSAVIVGDQSVVVKRKGIVLNTFTISPETTRRKKYNVALGTEASDTFAGTSLTEVVFEYDYALVQLKAVDLLDVDLPGTEIEIPGETGGFIDIAGASLVLPMAGVTANLRVGVVQVNATPISIVPKLGFSRRYEAATGTLLGELFTDPDQGYPEPVNEFIFQFDYATVAFSAVDLQGEVMPDVSFEFGTGGGTDRPLPFTSAVIVGDQDVTVKRKGVVLNTFQISPEASRRKVYNVLQGAEVGNTFSAGQVEVVFEYDFLNVELAAEDLMGSPVAGGEIDFIGETAGYIGLDGSSLFLPIAGVTANVRLNGQQINTAPIPMAPKQAFSRRYKASTGEFESEFFTDPAQGFPEPINQFVIEFDVATVVFESTYLNNTPLLGRAEAEVLELGGGYQQLPFSTAILLDPPVDGVSSRILTLNAKLDGQVVNTAPFPVTAVEAKVNRYLAETGVLTETAFFNGVKVSLRFDANQPPIADAGEDRLEPCESTSKHVVLDGSGSSDPDGDPLTYKWTEGAVVLAEGDQATAEQPTVLLTVGVHNITLTVTDPLGLQDTDEVVITVGDVVPPVVTITSHTDGQFVPRKNNHIEGTVLEANDLVSVKVNGHGSFSGNPPNFTFKGPTSALQPDGPHLVTVVAKDPAGNEGTASITLNVDTTAPELAILTPVAGTVLTENPSIVTVSGTVTDAGSGVASVTVNGEPAVVNAGTFTADVTIQGNGSRRIRVVATDNVGHDTKVTTHVIIDTLPPRVTISIPSTKPVVGQSSFLVTGRALDSGRGVQSVMVQFDSEPPVAATLDTEAGTYSALIELPSGTPNGEYTVQATASDGVLEATAETEFNLSIGGNDPVLTFAVKDHVGIGLEGVRVDLLKANGSGAGQRQNTNSSGEVVFLVDPSKTYLFKVYYRGGTWTSSTPVSTADPMEMVSTELSVLTLTSSVPAPIEGARVDLLRSNGSNTGVRMDTDGSGEAAFEVLPGFAHQFRVRFNGGSETTAVVVGGDDASIQTQLSELTLTSSSGGLIDGARVDLLRSNDSSTGIRENTSNGVAAFEVLPGFVHRFKVYFNGGAHITGDLTGGADTGVQTQLSLLTLSSSSGPGIEGVRVDLLRSNGSNTGIRVGTDSSGDAPFEVLPGFAHSFKIYHNGGTAITSEQTGGGTTVVNTVESEFTLTDSGGAPVEGARVDLLRSNRSNTGVRTSTNASGVAVFEVLEGYKHRFRVYYNGGDYTTEEVVF